MHAARNSGWLLVSFLAIVMAFPGGPGQAAGDNPLVEAARKGDVAAVRALIAKTGRCQRDRARWVDGASLGRLPLRPSDGAGAHRRRRQDEHGQ